MATPTPPRPPLLALLACLVACAFAHATPPRPVVRPEAPEAPTVTAPAPAPEAPTVTATAPAPEAPTGDTRAPWEARPGAWDLPDAPPREAYPEGYADKWERRARGYWLGRQGDLAGPLAGAVRARWPGVPVGLFVAFVASAGRAEDTAARTPVGLPNARFHEIGWFGTEAGPVFLGPNAAACSARWARRAVRRPVEAGDLPCRWGPAPSADPALPYSRWAALASDPRVVAILGRPATTAPGAWAGAAAIPDQVAVGLVSLGDHGDEVNAGLPASIRARDPRGPWFWWLAFMGWSSGDYGARRHVARYEAELARVPERSRPGALVAAAAEDALRRGAPRPGSHANPAFAVLRTLQKRALALRLAGLGGGDAAFFDGDRPPSPWHVEALVRAAYGRAPRRRAPGAPAPVIASGACRSACRSSPRSPCPPRWARAAPSPSTA